MLINAILTGVRTGDWKNLIISVLLMTLSSLIALCAHEAAHGYMAYKMGDHTAMNLGRVTLNPAKHLDLMGTLSMLVFGFGWAKPVPIHARNFKNPKWGMALTALAGPATNLILGGIGAILYSVTLFLATVIIPIYLPAVYGFSYFYATASVVVTFLYIFSIINLIYAFFNLIPLPPFDGSRFFFTFLPPKAYFGIMKYERFIMIGVFVILMITSRFFNFSPFSWLAEKVFDAISGGVDELLTLIYNTILNGLG